MQQSEHVQFHILANESSQTIICAGTDNHGPNSQQHKQLTLRNSCSCEQETQEELR